jgi:hypothetical protein
MRLNLPAINNDKKPLFPMPLSDPAEERRLLSVKKESNSLLPVLDIERLPIHNGSLSRFYWFVT